MVGLDGNPISYRKSTDQYGFWCLCVFMRLCRYAIEIIRANVWSGWAFYNGINIANSVKANGHYFSWNQGKL